MKRFVLFLLMVFFAGTSLFAASFMREGKWQVTMKMDLKGLPVVMPPMNHTQCVTKKDLDDNAKLLPAAGKNKDCEVKDYKVAGRTVTWKTECKDGSVSTGQITYGKDSYTGKMKVETVNKKRGKSTVNYKINGQRKGDC